MAGETTDPRAPAPEQPTCASCGQPATCFGEYEGGAVDSFACDDCCGHGQEDGHCSPLSVPRGPAPETPAKRPPNEAPNSAREVPRVLDTSTNSFTVHVAHNLYATLQRHVERLERENAELRKLACPHCQGRGWYEEQDTHTGDPVQVQCQACRGSGSSLVGLEQENAELRAHTRELAEQAKKAGDMVDEVERENAKLRETLRFRSEQRDQAESNADGWEATAKEAMQREEILRAQLAALTPAAEAMKRLEEWLRNHGMEAHMWKQMGGDEFVVALVSSDPDEDGYGPDLAAAIQSALAAAEKARGA